jgi:histidinol-phosphate aminotransferase
MLTDRRSWLKQTTLAALGLGINLRSLAGEDGLPYHISNYNSLINLGSNENPYGISPMAKQAIINMIGEANRYQFNVASLQSFKNDIANYFKIPADQLLITAGSGQGLSLLARYFSNGNIVAATPTFNVLQNTARRIGVEVIEIPLTKEKVNDLPGLLSAINNKTELVYVVNPNNPTGTILNPQALRTFCEEVSKKTVVLIDEAYIDYVDPPNNISLIDLPAKNENILVMRTFSKIHAMAGLRIGFIVGHPALIRKLDENVFAGSQFCLSNLSMTAALASLRDEGHRKQSKIKNDEARNFTTKSLAQLNMIAIPSQTNFIFVPLGNYKGNFADDMMAKNVIVRNNNLGDEKWARISIGTLEEMQRFIPILKATISG